MRGARPFDGPISIAVDALFPIPQSWSQRQWHRAVAGAILPTGRPDLDNIQKCVGDALNGVVWHDDKQIVSASIRKRYSNRPALVIKVTKEIANGRLFDAVETAA